MSETGQQLAQLETTGLLRRTQVQPDLEYLFRHALVQDAAYASLLKADRKRLHQLVGETLEQIYPDRLDELASLLARHFREVGPDSRALHYYTRAGDLAAQQYAIQEALAHYTSALDLAQHSDPAPALYRARGQAYETLGDFARALADFEAALRAAQAQADRPAVWQALIDLGCLWAERDYTQTGEDFVRAFELARTLDDPLMRAHSLNRLGNWRLNMEQPLAARQQHQEALAIFRELADRRGLAETLDLLGMTSYMGSDLQDSTVYYRQAVALFRALDDRPGLVSSLATLALCSANYQNSVMAPATIATAETARAGEEALRIARAIGSRAGEAYALNNLGLCRATAGDYTHTLALLQQALACAEEIGHRQWMTLAHFALGALYQDLFALDAARQQLENALVLAQQINSRFWVRCTTGQLASTCILQHDFARAAAVLNAALDPQTPAQTVGQRLAWTASAELALAAGNPSQALQIADHLLASAAHLADGRPIPRVAQLRGQALATLGQ